MGKDQEQTAIGREAYAQGADLGGTEPRHWDSETTCGQVGREADDCTHDTVSTQEVWQDQGHWQRCRE